jgi:DNA-binding SARP family transcriptional activator
MWFGILGPVIVRTHDAPDPMRIEARMPRTLLAALLLDANDVVSAGRLSAALWGEAPPRSATGSLYNHMTRLRRLLGPEAAGRVQTEAAGYTIKVDDSELDLSVFVNLSREGQRRSAVEDWTAASETLAEALGLWRGEPAANVTGLDAWQAGIQRVVETRWQALEARIEADLHLGRHRELIAELRALTIEHPLRESYHRQLMIALSRSGRQTEALDSYQQLRRTLVEQLGIEPSPPLQKLHQQLLRAAPDAFAPTAAPSRAPARPAGPARDAEAMEGARRQLPADTRVFTGRERELAQLLDLARIPGAGAAGTAGTVGTAGTTVVISAINGMGGVGKSALAVHAAHLLRAQYPDGQLFVDLRGYTSGQEQVTAGEALDWFLRSLGVPPKAIPEDLGQRAAYYRDRLDGTRTLVILDNAADAAQVRPLIPSAPGCLVLVTSRRRLISLDDAHLIALDALPESDAATLLHRVAGRGRLPEDSPAIGELLALCGCLPIAVRIAAAHLRHQRTLRIEDLVEQLRDENTRLDHLADDERSLVAVFGSSYGALSPAEQRMFRLLGLIPGPDFDAHAAAALAGIDHRSALRLLESLLDYSLLIEHTPGRYRFHDLVRVHAAQRADLDESRDARDAALGNLLHWYTANTDAAGRLIDPSRSPLALPAAEYPAGPPLFDTADAAHAWYEREYSGLRAATASAHTAGRHDYGWKLPTAMWPCLLKRGSAHDWLELAEAGLWCAGELPDREAEKALLNSKAAALCRLERYAEASAAFELALAVPSQSPRSHARIHNNLCALYKLQNRHEEAIEHGRRAIALNRFAGELRQVAGTLVMVAGSTFDLGRPQESLEHIEETVEISRRVGQSDILAVSLGGLGDILAKIGQSDRAALAFDEAMAAHRDAGDRWSAADTLEMYCNFLLKAGRTADATERLRECLTLMESLGDPRAAQIGALLRVATSAEPAGSATGS